MLGLKIAALAFASIASASFVANDELYAVHAKKMRSRSMHGARHNHNPQPSCPAGTNYPITPFPTDSHTICPDVPLYELVDRDLTSKGAFLLCTYIGLFRHSLQCDYDSSGSLVASSSNDCPHKSGSNPGDGDLCFHGCPGKCGFTFDSATLDKDCTHHCNYESSTGPVECRFDSRSGELLGGCDSRCPKNNPQGFCIKHQECGGGPL